MFRKLPIFLLLFCATTLPAQKKLFNKANDLFKNGEYGNAIPLYEEILQNRDGITTKSKLAYCYRMNNRLSDAEKLYAEVVQHKRARTETFLFYGEALMSNEKYAEAKKWFQKYAEEEPDDPQAAVMIRACDEVQDIKPYFKHAELIIFPENSDADDNSPVFWNNGIVFTSDRNSGVKLLKEKAGATGRDYLNIYFSKEREDSVSNFTKPSTLSSKLSELNKNSGNTSFSFDSTKVYFTKNSNLLNRKSAYNLQLFSADVSGNNFKKVKKLNFCSGDLNYMHPAISVDGNRLFFTSDKPGGEGGTDLYVSYRDNEKWGIPKNLGEIVNTPGNEGFPYMDEKGNLFFCSKGHVGFGGFDIFVTRQDADGNWKKPTNLGRPINSPLDDISISLERGGRRGLFTSSRMGGDDDIFLIYFDNGMSTNLVD